MRTIVTALTLAAIAAAIFVLSAQPNLHVSDAALVNFVAHKTGHIAAYAALAVACARLIEGCGGSRAMAVRLALLLVLLYGSSDELHQVFVAGRDPSPLDVAIDVAGGSLGLWLNARNRPRSSLSRRSSDSARA